MSNGVLVSLFTVWVGEKSSESFCSFCLLGSSVHLLLVGLRLSPLLLLVVILAVSQPTFVVDVVVVLFLLLSSMCFFLSFLLFF